MPLAKNGSLRCSFSECCAAETALQHWLFCSAEVIWTKSCTAANEKTALQHRKNCVAGKWRFSCRFPTGFKPPRFRHPRFRPAETPPWPRMPQISAVFQTMSFQCPKHHGRKPDMKQHKKTPRYPLFTPHETTAQLETHLFFARQKKRIFPFFPVGRPRPEPSPKTQPLQVAISLRQRVDLRSQKEGILGKKIAWGRVGRTRQKKEKRMHKKRWGNDGISVLHQLGVHNLT